MGARLGVEALNSGCSAGVTGKVRLGEDGLTGSGVDSSRLARGLSTTTDEARFIAVNWDCQAAICLSLYDLV